MDKGGSRVHNAQGPIIVGERKGMLTVWRTVVAMSVYTPSCSGGLGGRRGRLRREHQSSMGREDSP